MFANLASTVYTHIEYQPIVPIQWYGWYGWASGPFPCHALVTLAHGGMEECVCVCVCYHSSTHTVLAMGPNKVQYKALEEIHILHNLQYRYVLIASFCSP